MANHDTYVVAITTVRQLLSNGTISIDYVKTNDNLADSFTKGLSREKIDCASRGMGLKA